MHTLAELSCAVCVFESGDVIKAGHVNPNFPYDDLLVCISKHCHQHKCRMLPDMCVCVCVDALFYTFQLTFIITRTEVEQTSHIKGILNIQSNQPELHQPPLILTIECKSLLELSVCTDNCITCLVVVSECHVIASALSLF